MKTKLFSTFHVAALAFMLVGLSACDTAALDELNDPELAFLNNTLSQELGLSASQQSDVSQLFQSHDRGRDREPGFLWEVASDLQGNLTDEQKDRLFSRTDDMERGLSFRGLLGFPGGGGRYGIGGFKGAGRHGLAPADEALNLTEEQQETIRDLHTSYREQMRALVESHREGTIDDDTFVSEMFALRTAKKADLDAVLTDDQRDALENFQSEREAAFLDFRSQVNVKRNEVLGLSDDEIAAIDGLYQDQLDSRENLIEQLEAGAMSVADFQAEIAALEEARRSELQGLLSDVQYEIVMIHDALSVRSGKFGHRGGKGRFGERSGGNHTFNG